MNNARGPIHHPWPQYPNSTHWSLPSALPTDSTDPKSTEWWVGQPLPTHSPTEPLLGCFKECEHTQPPIPWYGSNSYWPSIYASQHVFSARNQHCMDSYNAKCFLNQCRTIYPHHTLAVSSSQERCDGWFQPRGMGTVVLGIWASCIIGWGQDEILVSRYRWVSLVGWEYTLPMEGERFDSSIVCMVIGPMYEAMGPAICSCCAAKATVIMVMSVITWIHNLFCDIIMSPRDASVCDPMSWLLSSWWHHQVTWMWHHQSLQVRKCLPDSGTQSNRWLKEYCGAKLVPCESGSALK